MPETAAGHMDRRRAPWILVCRLVQAVAGQTWAHRRRAELARARPCVWVPDPWDLGRLLAGLVVLPPFLSHFPFLSLTPLWCEHAVSRCGVFSPGRVRCTTQP